MIEDFTFAVIVVIQVQTEEMLSTTLNLNMSQLGVQFVKFVRNYVQLEKL